VIMTLFLPNEYYQIEYHDGAFYGRVDNNCLEWNITEPGNWTIGGETAEAVRLGGTGLKIFMTSKAVNDTWKGEVCFGYQSKDRFYIYAIWNGAEDGLILNHWEFKTE